MSSSVQTVAARESWLIHGKTVDNLNEALRSASEIDSSNVTYLREKYSTSLSVSDKHITEANVVPLVLKEEGLVVHTVTLVDNNANLKGSKIFFLDIATGIKHDNLTIDLGDYRAINSPCVVDSPNIQGCIKKVLVVVAHSVSDNCYDAVLRVYTFDGTSELIIEKHLTCDYLGISASASNKYFFSTPVVPVYASKLPTLRNRANPFRSNSTSRICVLVGVSTAESWTLDVDPDTNNPVELKNYSTGSPIVPLGINDIYYRNCGQDLDNRGFLYDDCLSKYVLQSQYCHDSSKGTDCRSSIYNLLNGYANTECGKLLCIDFDLQVQNDGEMDTYSAGELLWLTDTCPDPTEQKPPVVVEDENCDCCVVEDSQVLDSSHFLQSCIYDTNDSLKEQTHILITSIMKPGDVAVGFEQTAKNENEARIFPGCLNNHNWEEDPTPDHADVYVAWIRSYQEAKTSVNYNVANHVYLTMPIITPTINQNQNVEPSCPDPCNPAQLNANHINANGSGSIYGTETVNQTIVSYPRNPDGSYQFDNCTHPEYDVLVFAKLTDVLPLWEQTKMGGQGAGRSNIYGYLNSPFDEEYTLKESQIAIIECDDNKRATRVYKITDKFDSGLFVFNWLAKGDRLNCSQLNALEYRGAGVTGMPVIDIDDARVHFGTGRRNQIPLDSLYLENCEKLMEITCEFNNYYCFDASRFCTCIQVVECGNSGSTGKNEDALALMDAYDHNNLQSVFDGIVFGDLSTSVYEKNKSAKCARNKLFFYNSLVTVRLNSNLNNENIENTNGLWGRNIRIWDSLVTNVDPLSDFLTFAVDNDTAFSDNDFKRVPINTIIKRVTVSKPEYHELTTGAHIHYNIASQCIQNSNGKTTNFVSVFTKGGMVCFVQNDNVKGEYTAKGTFMCGIPRTDIISPSVKITSGPCLKGIFATKVSNVSCDVSAKYGGEGGSKYGSVADQFFLYGLMPNLAGFTLTRNSVFGASLTSTCPISCSDESFAICYTAGKAYIVCYDLNAISTPPANVPGSLTTGNIYQDEIDPYITAYIADLDVTVNGNLTGSLDLLIVPTGKDTPTGKFVRIYSKNDILGTLDPHHGNVRFPSTTIVPRYQLTYSAKSFSGVVVSDDSIYIQGGVVPADAKNNSYIAPFSSQNFRSYSIEY